MNRLVAHRSGTNTRRKAWYLFVAVAMVTSTGLAAGVAPVGAKVLPVTGGIRCTLTGPMLTFNPGLQYKEHLTGITKGRGPSSGAFNATLTGCTDPTLGPAPGGIDHGTLQAETHVSGSYCDARGGIKLRHARINWSAADNAVVGTTQVKLKMTVTTQDFYQPQIVDTTGTTTKRSNAFPGGTLSFSLPTTAPYWSISLNCFKFELTSLGVTDGPIALDAPASMP